MNMGIIKLLYSDIGLSIAEIAEVSQIPATVVGVYIDEHQLVPAAPKEESEFDRVRRLEVIKQLVFFPTYCGLESRILDSIAAKLEDAVSADEVAKLTRAYKELRTVGVPPQLVEQAAKDGTGITVQILNALA